MKYNPDVHHRKSIRLKEYDYSKEGMYFITICVQDRECILGKITNVGAPDLWCPEVQLTKTGQIIEEGILNIQKHYKNVKIIEYVVMPNHAHFIINILPGQVGSPAPTVGQIIHALKVITRKQIGYSIWQRNYYEHIIRNERELYRIIEYIKYNPLNWKNDHNYKE